MPIEEYVHVWAYMRIGEAERERRKGRERWGRERVREKREGRKEGETEEMCIICVLYDSYRGKKSHGVSLS